MTVSKSSTTASVPSGLSLVTLLGDQHNECLFLSPPLGSSQRLTRKTGSRLVSFQL